MERKAQLGSISHGTLRVEDLLTAFADELEWLQGSAIGAHIANARACVEALDEVPEDQQAIDDARETLLDLEDALNERAPAFCYFGAHEGDGSDFGFWPDWSSIEELPRVSDPSEVEAMAGQECLFVNDHGNCTVYAADGSVIFDCV